MRFYKIETLVKIFPIKSKLYKDVKIIWLLNKPRKCIISNDNNILSRKALENLNKFLIETDGINEPSSIAYWLKQKGFDTKIIDFDLTKIPLSILDELNNDYYKVFSNSDAYFLSKLNPEICGYINTKYPLFELNNIETIIAELEHEIQQIDKPYKQMIFAALRHSFSNYKTFKQYCHDISDNFFNTYYKSAFVYPYPFK